jgi:hypothetical protein
MDLRLSTSSKDTRGLEKDSNAKSAAPPHQRGTVMVRQAREKQSEAEMNSQGSSQATLIQLTSDQHQKYKSKLARSSAAIHFDHTYNGGALSKAPQWMFQTKEQLMPSRWGCDKQIWSKKWDGSSQNSVRINGHSKQIRGWRRCLQQQKDAVT